MAIVALYKDCVGAEISQQNSYVGDLGWLSIRVLCQWCHCVLNDLALGVLLELTNWGKCTCGFFCVSPYKARQDIVIDLEALDH